MNSSVFHPTVFAKEDRKREAELPLTGGKLKYNNYDHDNKKDDNKKKNQKQEINSQEYVLKPLNVKIFQWNRSKKEKTNLWID